MFAALRCPGWSRRARCGAVAPMKPVAVILALDATNHDRWCLYAAEPHAHGTVLLPAREIAERCMQAQQPWIGCSIGIPAIDVIAIESPVARFAKALIPQARVSGALLAVAAARHCLSLRWRHGSQAHLDRTCDADKVAMQAAAATYRLSASTRPMRWGSRWLHAYVRVSV